MQTCGENLLKLLLLSLGLFQVVSTASWYTASDGRRYFIEGSTSYNWLQALDQCSRRGLQLVVIDNASKNSALVTLLKSVFGTSRDLWIGHHDEFNTKMDYKRNFYSASTGAELNFSYWIVSTEPNNQQGKEHCVQIFHMTDFGWNDSTCETPESGYVCEEHYQTTNCRQSMDSKRQATNQMHTHLSLDFERTKNTIEKINEQTHMDSDNLLQVWEKSSNDIIEDFRREIKELILKKPYLEVIIGDVGEFINELALEKQREMAKITQQTRQFNEELHLNAKQLANAANSEFAEKLARTQSELNKLLVY